MIVNGLVNMSNESLPEKSEEPKEIYEFMGISASGCFYTRNSITGEWWISTKKGPRKLKPGEKTY